MLVFMGFIFIDARAKSLGICIPDPPPIIERRRFARFRMAASTTESIPDPRRIALPRPDASISKPLYRRCPNKPSPNAFT